MTKLCKIHTFSLDYNFFQFHIQSNLPNYVNEFEVMVDLRRDTYENEIIDNKCQLGNNLWSYLRPLIRLFFNVELADEGYYLEASVGNWFIISSTSHNKKTWDEINEIALESVNQLTCYVEKLNQSN